MTFAEFDRVHALLMTFCAWRRAPVRVALSARVRSGTW